jgi:hypothetical protein
MLDHLLKLERQSTTEAKEAEKPEHEHEERTATILNFTGGLDSLKLASKCFRTLIQMSSEQQQADKDLRGCLLVMRKL